MVRFSLFAVIVGFVSLSPTVSGQVVLLSGGQYTYATGVQTLQPQTTVVQSGVLQSTLVQTVQPQTTFIQSVPQATYVQSVQPQTTFVQSVPQTAIVQSVPQVAVVQASPQVTYVQSAPQLVVPVTTAVPVGRRFFRGRYRYRFR